MRKFIGCFLLFFVVCAVFAGSFSGFILVYCAVISAAAAAVTVFVFNFASPSDFNPLKIILYFFVLLKSVYSSAFKTIFLFLRSGGRARTELVDAPLKTEKPLYRLIICQSVTLTPGTVSVNSKTGTISVLKFSADSLEGLREFDTFLMED